MHVHFPKHLIVHSMHPHAYHTHIQNLPEFMVYDFSPRNSEYTSASFPICSGGTEVLKFKGLLSFTMGAGGSCKVGCLFSANFGADAGVSGFFIMLVTASLLRDGMS